MRRRKSAPERMDVERLPRCVECGAPMVVAKGRRHFVCDESTAIGKPCTCRPGCSRATVGDGPVPCDPGCVPCRLGRGDSLQRPKR